MYERLAHEDHVSGACLFLLPNVLEGSFEMIIEGDLDRAAARYTLRPASAGYQGIWKGGNELSNAETVQELNYMRRQCDQLRAALAGLIGAESEEELRTMEAMIRLTAAPDADKAAMLNAIHALLP
jgi:Spy/CpxP family protein refolding chaperone